LNPPYLSASPRPICRLIGAHAVPSVPKEPMTIRLFGALLCGAAMMLAAQTDLAQAQSGAITGRVTNSQGGPEATGARKNAQSDRNNRVQGNFIGTSRGVLVSPYQTGGGGEGRRRSKGQPQGNPAPKAGLSLNFQEFKTDYKKYEKPKGQKRGDR
jgi:hypothetical protein